jgi:hypothetical protein
MVIGQWTGNMPLDAFITLMIVWLIVGPLFYYGLYSHLVNGTAYGNTTIEGFTGGNCSKATAHRYTFKVVFCLSVLWVIGSFGFVLVAFTN